MIRGICFLIGYVFGLFQTAFFYGKLHGIDIREHGSGNAGTTNTLRVLGTKAGFIVLFGDMLKCILAVVAVTLLFKDSHADMLYLLKAYAALGAVIGHDFPFYMRFKGGKGIASTAGFLFAFHPVCIPMVLIAFLLPFNLTHFVSLGSLCINVGFVVTLIVLGQTGALHMPQAYLNEMYAIAVLIAALAFFQHRTNIQKLLNGTERKTYLFKKNKVD